MKISDFFVVHNASSNLDRVQLEFFFLVRNQYEKLILRCQFSSIKVG